MLSGRATFDAAVHVAFPSGTTSANRIQHLHHASAVAGMSARMHTRAARVWAVCSIVPCHRRHGAGWSHHVHPREDESGVFGQARKCV